MSRSGYTDDYDDGGGRLALYRGTVASATRGKRGQEFFKALVVALDALPEKKLITHELQTTEGNVCAIGALGKQRAIDMTELDPENPIAVGDTFNIAECLAREVGLHERRVGNFRDTGSPLVPHARVGTETDFG